jgi:histidinol-phosphate aminotransferase
MVRLRTFAKAYGMAGARIGYAIADSAIVAALDRIRAHFGVAKLCQEMALAAFGDQAFLTDIAAQTAEGREHYSAIASSAGIATLPSSANFVAFDFGNPLRSKMMAAWLEENDVFVRRPIEAPLDRLIRITVGPRAARDYLAEVMIAGMAKLPAGPLSS